MPSPVSPVGIDHSLSGKVWDVAGKEFVEPERLVRALAAADIVLLGEQHDNADHHLAQAWMLQRLIARGRPPALAMEQLDLEDQPVLDGVADRRVSADELAALLEWERSGWPSFDLYRPVFEVALAQRLPLIAANLSRARLHGGSRGEEQEELVPMPARLRRDMAEEIAESHCGYGSHAMTEAMIHMQRRRDAQLARAAAEAAGAGAGTPRERAVVLIAGLGHARRDRGVPLVLRDRAPEMRVLSVGLVEVSPELAVPQEYAAALRAQGLPFDYVWFTPAPQRQDPCVEFREQLEKMHRKRPPH